MYRFKGVWLEIKKAPEPEVILWENLHITSKNRFLRSVFATFVTSSLLIACIFVISIGQYYDNKA
jgi:hypothetical protein